MNTAMSAHREQLRRERRDEQAAMLWSEGKLNWARVTELADRYDGASYIIAGWHGEYPTWDQLAFLAHMYFKEPLWFFQDLP